MEGNTVNKMRQNNSTSKTNEKLQVILWDVCMNQQAFNQLCDRNSDRSNILSKRYHWYLYTVASASSVESTIILLVLNKNVIKMTIFYKKQKLFFAFFKSTLYPLASVCTLLVFIDEFLSNHILTTLCCQILSNLLKDTL